jgi:multidrug efflux system membrane fusion protein
MTRNRILLLGATAAVVVAVLGWSGKLPFFRGQSAQVGESLPPGPPGAPPGGGNRRSAMRSDGPVPVLAARVAREDVDLFVEGIGTVQADAMVTVRAQVSGRLLEVRFKEGQDVAEGDVLAVIDPASYQAVYDQAAAKRDQDLADLANARADLDRYERLAKSEAGSRQQADQQRTTVAKLEAQTRVDKAVMDAARIDLDHTQVRAPIAGRTGVRVVDVGNLVSSTDTTGLVSIARIHPISVVFTVPSRELPALLAAKARGDVAVTVVGSDRKSTVETGTVTVIDNQVDTTTGTVKLKASLPNTDTRLWPGQFVDLRVAVAKMASVPTIPSAAVQRAADGAWVYVVGDDDKVKRRTITVRRQDETRAVIADGLADGERVVTTGFARLTDGAAVRVDAEPATDAAAKPADAPKRQHNGNGNGRPKAGAEGAAPAPQGSTQAPAAPGAGSKP